MDLIEQIETYTEKSTVPTQADLIIDYLIDLEVDYLFGVPGGAIEPLYNALSRRLKSPKNLPVTHTDEDVVPFRKQHRNHSQGIRPIVARHEAGAVFMADGYTRETGKLGVCCATTGPGATNLLTGVASAYIDKIPMLIITPQTALSDFGKMGFQESSSDGIDTVSMFEHCTRYNSLVSHPDQLTGKLYSALINAYRAPQGPVHLSIPMDVLNTPTNKESNYLPPATHLFKQTNAVDQHAYSALLGAISKSKRMVLLVGSACKNAAADIAEFANITNADIISTPCGKRWVDAYNPHYQGVFGFAGHPSAMDALMKEEVDIILAIGTGLGELSTCGWNDSLLNPKLIHISQNIEDFSRSPMAGLHVPGDICSIFKSLINDISLLQAKPPCCSASTQPLPPASPYDTKRQLPRNLKFRNEQSYHSDEIPLKPQRVMKELAQRFPKGTRYLADTGNAWSWVTHYLMDSALDTQRIGFGFGTMGWAIGAAVGTALANHGNPTVCITGDGSYLMNGQEITVAVSEQLPVLFIVLNDQALGMIKHGQRLSGAEQIGFELPPINFAMMAEAVGATGITIKSPEDFAQLNVGKLLAGNKPTLLDIHIDPEETPPMGSRIKTLNKGR